MFPCFPYFGLTSFFQILFLALVKRREEDFYVNKNNHYHLYER